MASTKLRLSVSMSCAVAVAASAGCSLLVSLDGLRVDASDATTEASADGNVDGARDGGAPDGDGQSLDDAAISSAYAREVMKDTPIAYWRFDDDGGIAVDSTSNHLDGTYGTAVSHGPGLIGRDSGRSAVFPGADGGHVPGILVPRSALLEPTAAISVEAWIRPLGVNGEIASYGQQVTTPYQPWVLQETLGVSTLYTAARGRADGTTALQRGSIYHVVGTFDGAKILVFVNGVLDANRPASGSLGVYDGVTGLGIGGGVDGNSPFNGQIDELAVYDHVLSPARITAHYFAGAP